jgi:hypothetical protein
LTVRDTYTDLEITLADEAKVRLPFKPEIDETTKRVKPESIRPDRNDPDHKLGGIKGSEKDLKKKQWVVVALGRTADKPPQFKATALAVVAEK